MLEKMIEMVADKIVEDNNLVLTIRDKISKTNLLTGIVTPHDIRVEKNGIHINVDDTEIVISSDIPYTIFYEESEDEYAIYQGNLIICLS